MSRSTAAALSGYGICQLYFHLGRYSQRYWLVIPSFLRPSPFTPLTVLRISEYIRELLPPAVFNVVTGGHDLWPWTTSHSGIDLITFTRSTNIGKRVSESAAGTLKPLTLEL